jgi:predicted dehydrogenase
MSNNINIGLIGSGFIAETHAVSITRYLRGAHLVGVAGGSRAISLANKYDIIAFPNIDVMLASENVDAVIVTSPHNLHETHGIKCAQAGKHVLMEKPMCTTVEASKSLINLFDKNNLHLMVAFTQRYRESNLLAKKIIDSGKLGEITMISEWGLVPGGMESYPQWQNSSENLGTLFGYGIHNLDKLRWFLGCEATSVCAQIRESENGVETNSMGLYTFSDGSIVNLWTGVDLPRPGFEGGSYRSYIVGTEGLLDVDGYGAVRFCPYSGEWKTLFIQPPIDWRGEGAYAPNRMNSFNNQNQEFIDSILEKRRPAITGQDGLLSVHMALGLYKAARTKSVIQL